MSIRCILILVYSPSKVYFKIYQTRCCSRTCSDFWQSTLAPSAFYSSYTSLLYISVSGTKMHSTWKQTNKQTANTITHDTQPTTDSLRRNGFSASQQVTLTNLQRATVTTGVYLSGVRWWHLQTWHQALDLNQQPLWDELRVIQHMQEDFHMKDPQTLQADLQHFIRVYCDYLYKLCVSCCTFTDSHANA